MCEQVWRASPARATGGEAMSDGDEREERPRALCELAQEGGAPTRAERAAGTLPTRETVTFYNTRTGAQNRNAHAKYRWSRPRAELFESALLGARWLAAGVRR